MVLPSRVLTFIMLDTIVEAQTWADRLLMQQNHMQKFILILEIVRKNVGASLTYHLSLPAGVVSVAMLPAHKLIATTRFLPRCLPSALGTS